MKGGIGFLAGLMLGIVVSGFAYGMKDRPPRPDPQQEYDAMRTCMQYAGKVGCRMTIQDFVRYYELEELLADGG